MAALHGSSAMSTSPTTRHTFATTPTSSFARVGGGARCIGCFGIPLAALGARGLVLRTATAMQTAQMDRWRAMITHVLGRSVVRADMYSRMIFLALRHMSPSALRLG